MENASKALIIAGAILLSILLISLGIMVYNNAKGTVSDANLDAETTQAFNTKITQYCGTDKTGTTMNSLVDAISSLNGSQKGKATQHFINLKIANGTNGATSNTAVNFTKDTTTASYPSFSNSYRYKATYKTDGSGYINEVTIANN